ncbi:hypothetical protein [Pseudoponticoccus marisrubri]|uniref:DUF1127 domain-containing protein n=1 Tax=Pseudoponticoccus marisrubri TaxID=1685382 RepID=A0A0W7WNN7_9RHOB|nr:hypothetical protein [Pseudoponticoccus marisrubri]KUF12210.1 hypothetical protein AVJ23_00285 [Pseudoponticoccus marisrubri]
MPRDNVQIGVGHTPLGQKIDWYFAERGLGFNANGLRRARLREIIVLESRSDAELARMGLTRDQILPHVFRDLLAA